MEEKKFIVFYTGTVACPALTAVAALEKTAKLLADLNIEVTGVAECCPVCSCDGQVEDKPCSRCGGVGYVGRLNSSDLKDLHDVETEVAFRILRDEIDQ